MPTDKNPGRKVLAPFSEGHMDVKYLATRYEKGVTKVAELMSEQQRYVHLGNLQDALPDFISFASKLSLPDTCLWLSLRRKGFVFCLVAQRLIIAILDATLWPQSTAAVS